MFGNVPLVAGTDAAVAAAGPVTAAPMANAPELGGLPQLTVPPEGVMVRAVALLARFEPLTARVPPETATLCEPEKSTWPLTVKAPPPVLTVPVPAVKSAVPAVVA